jgi:hypothetical protein
MEHFSFLQRFDQAMFGPTSRNSGAVESRFASRDAGRQPANQARGDAVQSMAGRADHQSKTHSKRSCKAFAESSPASISVVRRRV